MCEIHKTAGAMPAFASAVGAQDDKHAQVMGDTAILEGPTERTKHSQLALAMSKKGRKLKLCFLP